MKKITLDFYIVSPTKINSRWMKHLNVNNKNVKKKKLGKNQGDYIYNLIFQDRDTRDHFKKEISVLI